MKKKHILILIIAPIIASILALSRVYYAYNVWSYSGPDKTFTIKSGQGFSSINGKLIKGNFIYSGKLFHRYCQFYKCLNKFKAGEYEIKNGMTMKTIIDLLLLGHSKTIKITIPEGKNSYEIAKILLNQKVIKSYATFIALIKDKKFRNSQNLQGPNLEGYLYPETYYFLKNMSEKAVIIKMIQQFKLATKNISFSNPKLSKFQVLTLASIVEKETGASSERPIIAGVFLNRLKKHMRLQSDPTTIYGIYENFNGNLRKKHLLQKTAYNTYKIPALPIGPICNPGIQAIKAVLEPTQHNFLYFVSKNNGRHIFSETYKKHRKAVNLYQKKSSMRKGKSWRDLKK